MATRELVLEQALSLPVADQAYLVDMLEQHLAAEPFPNAEIGDAWSRVLEQRIAAYDRGEVSAVSPDESLNRIRDAVHELRNEQTLQ